MIYRVIYVRETRARARVSFVTRQNRRTFNHQFMNERLSSFRWKSTQREAGSEEKRNRLDKVKTAVRYRRAKRSS